MDTIQPLATGLTSGQFLTLCLIVVVICVSTTVVTFFVLEGFYTRNPEHMNTELLDCVYCKQEDEQRTATHTDAYGTPFCDAHGATEYDMDLADTKRTERTEKVSLVKSSRIPRK